MKERILVISHGHPDFNTGGGEVAAYNIFNAYKHLNNVEETWFLARIEGSPFPNGMITLRQENEYLWEQSLYDWHLMKGYVHSLENFYDFISLINPTIVHSHHYIHLGIEYIQTIKQYNPKIKILFTLHEFLAICTNEGRMIKSKTNKLCFKESPEDCHRCFPERTKNDFWLRKHYIKSYFELIDYFIAPSSFLKERYIEWGIPKQKISVIENIQLNREKLLPRSLSINETRNHFAFFGQILESKGLDIIFESLLIMQKQIRKNIYFEIHGCNLEGQSEQYKNKLIKYLKQFSSEKNIQYIGSYTQSELPKRLENIDWVVVPSIWWENSPVIIQEAFTYGRPVIVSDIGGMAEKVRNGIDGIHISMGNPKAWADTLTHLSLYTDRWNDLYNNILRPISNKECAERHLKIFN